ncbi:Hypothetical protein A7982_04754 [Minicystis rosea]|nr:Hypothetical protein A7982_04754 [Minicystis rosea]
MSPDDAGSVGGWFTAAEYIEVGKNLRVAQRARTDERATSEEGG